MRKSELINLRAAISFVNQLEHGGKGGRGVILQTLTVSGTIRGCQREIKRRHRRAIQSEAAGDIKAKLIESESEIDRKLNVDE